MEHFKHIRYIILGFIFHCILSWLLSHDLDMWCLIMAVFWNNDRVIDCEWVEENWDLPVNRIFGTEKDTSAFILILAEDISLSNAWLLQWNMKLKRLRNLCVDPDWSNTYNEARWDFYWLLCLEVAVTQAKHYFLTIRGHFLNIRGHSLTITEKHSIFPDPYWPYAPCNNLRRKS